MGWKQTPRTAENNRIRTLTAQKLRLQGFVGVDFVLSGAAFHISTAWTNT
jgi:hypothetical protein